MNDALTTSGSDQPNRGPDIERLLALLELAEGPERPLDEKIAAVSGYECLVHPTERPRLWRDPAGKYIGLAPRFTASLDAAVMLVPEGVEWLVRNRSPRDCEGDYRCFANVNDIYAHGDTGPLALCIAALRANVAKPKSVPSLSPTPDRGASSQESLPESTTRARHHDTSMG